MSNEKGQGGCLDDFSGEWKNRRVNFIVWHDGNSVVQNQEIKLFLVAQMESGPHTNFGKKYCKLFPLVILGNPSWRIQTTKIHTRTHAKR